MRRKSSEKFQGGFDDELGLALTDCNMKVFSKMEDLIKNFKKFTKSDIRYFMANGVISNFPLSLLDTIVLEKIHKIWKTESLLRINITKFSKKKRKKILIQSDFRVYTRLEVWLLTRIIRFKTNNKNAKLCRKEIREDAIKFLKLKNNKRTKMEIDRIIDRLNKKIIRDIEKGKNFNSIM